MWLAQFVCAQQFFKTLKELCGYTVLSECAYHEEYRRTFHLQVTMCGILRDSRGNLHEIVALLIGTGIEKLI
jgi:hypothetical protein